MLQEMITSSAPSPQQNTSNFKKIINSELYETTSSTSVSCPSLQSKSHFNSIDYCDWTFNVTIDIELLPTECLAISGNCPELGNWKPELCVFMENKTNNVWKSTVKIPANTIIEYRYFICMLNSNTNAVLVRRWETYYQPRRINTTTIKTQFSFSNDIFGYINDQSIQRPLSMITSRGWLINETILQLKIFNNPFLWCDTTATFDNISMKITPMSMENGGLRPIFIPIEPSVKAIVEYTKFEYGKTKFKLQPNEFGVEWNKGDIIIFHITVNNLKDVAYLLEIYGVKNDNLMDCDDDDDTLIKNKSTFPKHLGYYYLLPNAFSRSEGDLKIPFTNALNHQNLVMLNASYLIIKPLTTPKSTKSSAMAKLNMNLRTTCMNFWKSQWTGLDIGHRGAGVSFRVPDMYYPENTIASLKNAAKNGADMIELDVHVTKDGIPVVYHDFHVNISITSSYPRYGSDLIPVLIKDLTYNELKNLKTYHLLDGVIRDTPTFENCPQSDEYKLFPKLEDVFTALDEHIGIDIEFKWPQQLIDSTWESQQTIDKNLFVDCILQTILRKGYGRCMILSCFDADICTMLKFKQNIYPVLFLTLGPTQRYPLYMDPRCNSIEMAVCNAQAMEFLGIIPHTEDLIKDPEQVNLVKNQNQIIFCWGDDTNCKEIVDKLKQMGLNGIIYDRVDEIVACQNKMKIFLFNETNNNIDDDDENVRHRRNSSNNNNRNCDFSYNDFFSLQYVEEKTDDNDDDDNDK